MSHSISADSVVSLFQGHSKNVIRTFRIDFAAVELSGYMTEHRDGNLQEMQFMINAAEYWEGGGRLGIDLLSVQNFN